MTDPTQVVSSDDVIEAYRELLSASHHENAMLRARVAKLLRMLGSVEPTGPRDPAEGTVSLTG